MSEEESGFVHHFEAGDDAVLLLLHGTGGNEHDLMGLGRAIAPGAAMLSPRGKVLENGMPRFFRRLAEGIFDIEDLHARTDELAEWISAVSKRNEIDDLPMIAVGFSNGANIAGSLLLSHPGLLSGAVLLRPMVPFDPDPVPSLTGTRVLISAGLADQLISVPETERLDELLRTCDADVELAWQPGGHGLTNADVELIQRWFANHVWQRA